MDHNRTVTLAISQLPCPLPRKAMEQILGTVSKCRKNKKETETSQNGYSKGKSCLTNMTPSSGTERLALWLRGEQGVLDTLTWFQRPC